MIQGNSCLRTSRSRTQLSAASSGTSRRQTRVHRQGTCLRLLRPKRLRLCADAFEHALFQQGFLLRQERRASARRDGLFSWLGSSSYQMSNVACVHLCRLRLAISTAPASDCARASRTARASLYASRGGTAFPIWVNCCTSFPQNSKESGKLCSRAASRTVILRLFPSGSLTRCMSLVAPAKLRHVTVLEGMSG